MSVILNFVSLLRYLGLPISPDETITAQRVFQLLGMESKTNLRMGLQSAIVKRSEDIATFNEGFSTFFSDSESLSPSSIQEETNQEPLERFLQRLRNSPRTIDEMIGELLTQGRIDQAIQVILSKMMQGDSGMSGFGGEDLHILQENLQRAFRSAYGLRLPIRDLTPAQRENLPASTIRFAAVLQQFLQRIQREVENIDPEGADALPNWQTAPDSLSNGNQLLNRDLSELSTNVDKIKQQLVLLGRILASRERRRRKQAKFGKLDFRKTFRKNLKNGGIPLELLQRRKRIQDPEIIILNDISRSTRWVADWFFVLTFAAQSVYRKVRIFEFDNTMVEVTKALDDRKTIDQALEEREKCWETTLRPRRIHSDYQTSLEDFFTLIRYQPVTRRTSVLLFGDCRDFEGMWTVNKPLSANLVRRICTKAKKVVVLNPEDPRIWNTGDSVVSHFQAAGAQIHSVSTIQDLIRFVYSF